MKEDIFRGLTDQQMELINKYAKDDMYELYKLCKPLIKRKNVAQMEDMELLDDALMVLVESAKSYNPEIRCSFSTYLFGNIKRSFADWTRDRLRWKRCNLELDKNGNIKLDEDGKYPIPIPNVQLDTKNDDGLMLQEVIPSNFDVHEEASKNVDTDDKVEKFLQTLSNKQRKILELKMEDIPKEEILHTLHISDREYQSEMKKIQLNSNLSWFTKNVNDCNYKEETNMTRVIKMQEAEGYRTDKVTMYQLIDQKRNGDMNCEYILQRKPFQWSTEERNRYICRILSNLPIPEIVLCEQNIKGMTIAHLIDGLQRLSYAEAFKENRFKIGANGAERHLIQYRDFKTDENGNRVFDEDGIPIFEIKVCDVVNKKYQDLPDELKKRFNDFNVNVTKFFDCTDEQIADHIRDYNNHASMNSEQFGITKISPNTAKMIKSVTKNGFFKNCGKFTLANDVKGKIDRAVAEMVMLFFHKDNWKANVKATYGYIDENASQAEFDIISSDLSQLESVIENEGKEINNMFTTTYTPMWMAVFHKFLTYGKDLHMFVDFLNAYNNELKTTEIDGVSMEDFKDQQSKKKATITGKVDLLIKLMEQYFGIDEDSTENNVVDNHEDVISANNDEITTDNGLMNFIKNNIKDDVTDEDIQDYADYVDDTVRISSPIYRQCKQALIAIAAYVYQNNTDEEFAEFIDGYANNTYTFDQDQVINYNNMKCQFDQFLQKGAA